MIVLKKIMLSIMLIILSLILVSCDKEEEKENIEPTINTNIIYDYPKKPTNGTTPKDYSVIENIKIAEGIIVSNPYYKTITSGVAHTKIGMLSNNQSVYSEKVVYDNEILYISITDSKYKSEALKRYYQTDNVLIQKGKVTSTSTATWDGKITEYSYDYIKENIGYIHNILTGYIITDESVIESTVLEETNHYYSVKIVLNHEIGCALTKKEIKFNSGAVNLPEFETSELTIHMNKDWQVEQIEIHDVYQITVKLGVKITAPVDSIITETFYYPTKEELKSIIDEGAIVC